MKKHLLVLLFGVIVLSWCGQKTSDTIDVNAITDLVALQNMIAMVSADIAKWSIDPEEAQSLIEQLQQRYLDLTDITQQSIEAQFDVVQKTLNKQSSVSYALPLWAKKMNMTEPKWMEFNKVLSKQYTNSEWYSSTILVYKGDYTTALQQVESIAKKAGLYISKTFEEGQTIAQADDLKYISWLDVGSLQKGVIYVNHELLDTNIENLLSVSVDQDGTLIIEATKYK